MSSGLAIFLATFCAQFFPYLSSIYTVHDEIKDKNFELDLSWVGASKCDFFLF